MAAILFRPQYVKYQVMIFSVFVNCVKARTDSCSKNQGHFKTAWEELFSLRALKCQPRIKSCVSMYLCNMWSISILQKKFIVISHKYWLQEIGCCNAHINLKFHRWLSSNAVEMTVNFQSNWKTLNTDFTPRRLCKIYTIKCVVQWNGPLVNEGINVVIETVTQFGWLVIFLMKIYCVMCQVCSAMLNSYPWKYTFNSLWSGDIIWQQIWVSIGSSNGLLPHSTKPFLEPILTNHQRCSVALIWELFHKKFA